MSAPEPNAAFLTDAVRTGLPIHIAAQLTGHDELNTTRRYAATPPSTRSSSTTSIFLGTPLA
jgi:hypothetical protein